MAASMLAPPPFLRLAGAAEPPRRKQWPMLCGLAGGSLNADKPALSCAPQVLLFLPAVIVLNWLVSRVVTPLRATRATKRD